MEIIVNDKRKINTENITAVKVGYFNGGYGVKIFLKGKTVPVCVATADTKAEADKLKFKLFKMLAQDKKLITDDDFKLEV